MIPIEARVTPLPPVKQPKQKIVSPSALGRDNAQAADKEGGINRGQGPAGTILFRGNGGQ